MKKSYFQAVKRILSLFMVCIVTLCVFCGCSGNGEWVESEIVVYEDVEVDGTDNNTDTSESVTGSNSASGETQNSNSAVSNSKATNEPPEKLNNPNITFFWPMTIEDQPKMTEICKAFEKKYGGKVTIVGAGDWDGRGGRLTNLIQSKTQVDVVFVSATEDYPTYPLSKIVRPLDKSKFDFSKAPFKNADKVKTSSLNGDLFAISNMNDEYPGYLTVYNKTMFENAGIETPLELYKKGKWDWNSFRESARTLSDDTDGNGQNDIYGFAEYDINGLACSNGTSLLNYDGKEYSFKADDSKLNKAYQLFYDMFNVDKSVQPSPWIWQAEMEAGRLAMVFMPPTIIKSMTDNGSKQTFDFVPLPKGPDASSYYTNGVVDNTFCMGATCKNPEGAYAFIKFWIQYTNNDKEQTSGFNADQIKRVKEYSNLTLNNYSPTGFGSLKMDARSLFFELRYGKSVSTAVASFGNVLNQDIDVAMIANK